MGVRHCDSKDKGIMGQGTGNTGRYVFKCYWKIFLLKALKIVHLTLACSSSSTRLFSANCLAISNRFHCGNSLPEASCDGTLLM